MKSLIALPILVLVATTVGCAKEPKVDVTIYKHRETGNIIYCETGTLTDPPYEDIGAGKIGESKASGC